MKIFSSPSRFLLNVTINDKRVFNPDGTACKSDLKIVNLRRNASSAGITWEEVSFVHLCCLENFWQELDKSMEQLTMLWMDEMNVCCVTSWLFKVGSWNTETGLDIKDIVWPDNSHVPPQGVPEKFHIKITFLEEPPFIIISDPDPVTGRCTMNRGVTCYLPQGWEYGRDRQFILIINSDILQSHSGQWPEIREWN